MQHTCTSGYARGGRALMPILLTALLFAAPVTAQVFESHYGEDMTADIGEDIKAIRYCPGGGSIVSGTRRVPGFGTEALVTRVDDNGSALWQFAYRVAGSNDTRSQAIVELRSPRGFALTGSVLRGNQDYYIYVMRLECDGRPAWTRMLDNLSAGHQAIGNDVFEASTPIAPSLVNDIVVVGDETVSGRRFGRIARLQGNGNVIWNHAYLSPAHPAGMRFEAATASRSASSVVPDIVVAGSLAQGTNWQFDRRALMFRVSSSGLPICNTYMGSNDPASEDFRGISAQGTAQFAGGNVLVGSSIHPISPDSEMMYMVRFRPGFCVPEVQAMWSDPSFGAAGFDLIETSVNPPAVPGALAATGSIRGTTPSGDGFVVLAEPNNLSPVWTPIRFGTQGPRTEGLVAIDQKGDQFVMAGSSNSDWNGVGDPLAFYMVQTSSGMRTQCAIPWQNRWQPVALPRERFQPEVKRITNNTLAPVQVLDARGEGYCCP